MKHFSKFSTYLLFFVVFTMATIGTYIFKTNFFIGSIFSIPAVTALLGIIYEIYIENRKHEHVIELLYREKGFAFGTASHMAQVAYDKHVVFCEE